MIETRQREPYPIKAGTVYPISGSAEGVSFEAHAYCTRAGLGTFDFVGVTSGDNPRNILIENHPLDSISPAKHGHSLGQRVALSALERGNARYNHYYPYLKLLAKSRR